MNNRRLQSLVGVVRTITSLLREYGEQFPVSNGIPEPIEAKALYLALAILQGEPTCQKGNVGPTACAETEVQQRIEALLKESRVTAMRRLSGDAEAFARLYEALVPQAERRHLGQFWTPEPVARLMAQWAIQRPDDLFVDPGAGPGIFLEQAVCRKRALGADPETIARNLVGYEIAPTMRLMAATALENLQQGLGQRVLLDDYLLAQERPSPTAIACNPPYTRHHHLPEVYKGPLRERLERHLRVRVSRYSSLFVYFFLRSAMDLAPEGRIAYITPTELFEAKYACCVTKILADFLRLRAVIRFHPELEVFPGVDAAPCVVLAEGCNAEPSKTFALLQVRSLQVPESILTAITNPDVEGAFPWGTIERVPVARLQTGKKDAVRFQRTEEQAGWLPLLHVARALRGIATGANEFFLFTDEDVRRRGLERDALRPVITKTRDTPGYALESRHLEALAQAGRPIWLLYLMPEDDLGCLPKVEEYLTLGLHRGIDQGVLVQTRKAWYLMERREPPPILYTYLGRTRPRFIWNRAGAQALTTFLLIYPHKDLVKDEIDIKALLAILNSNGFLQGLRAHARSYGWEAIKIEPREIEQVPCPDFRQIGPSVRRQLASLFEKLCDAKGEGIEQAVKAEIGAVIATLSSSLTTPAIEEGRQLSLSL